MGSAARESRYVMTRDLEYAYRGYIACLNAQDWSQLHDFVGEDVQYNGATVGLAGYRSMLERDYREIPDLRFHVQLLVCEAPWVAARLDFDCTPVGRFLDIDVNGRRVSFTENVFYAFRLGKIGKVWSVIDKAAIEAQLA
jgi:predicted ester cyclase